MKDWKKMLVSPTATILKVVEAIDAGALQIALVVDENRRLLGTVTDGDIRRGILRGVALSEAVEKVMRQKPVVVSSDKEREEILSLMKKRQIRQIPILDRQGRVVGIEVLDDLIGMRPKGNWVMLMVGGLGTRLRPLTDECPKPLLKVGTKPILEIILESFIEYGFRKFNLAVNYKDEMIKDYFGDGSRWGVEIRYIQEAMRMGTAGALTLLPDKPKDPVVVMNGDLVTKVNFDQLLEFHKELKAQATMCVREYDLEVPFGVVQIENHKILNVDEKPVQKFFVNAGIYVLEPEILEMIPKESFYDMPNLFNKLLAEKIETVAFPVREYWIDIGRMEDLTKVSGEIAEVLK